jgi:hypothetical protein
MHKYGNSHGLMFQKNYKNNEQVQPINVNFNVGSAPIRNF